MEATTKVKVKTVRANLMEVVTIVTKRDTKLKTVGCCNQMQANDHRIGGIPGATEVAAGMSKPIHRLRPIVSCALQT